MRSRAAVGRDDAVWVVALPLAPPMTVIRSMGIVDPPTGFRVTRTVGA